ncbi:MAG: hypothetical protein JWN76_1411 [Chitinophagaceae bacterium]|nr:hypothetical protein [Chitinophagaceae bacterium]
MILHEISAQSVIYLYDKKVPGFTGCAIKEEESKNQNGLTSITKVMQPSLTVFLPKNNSKPLTAVIICPGGGYSHLAIDHEGYEVAKAFNDAGIAAFILKYRLPNLTCFSNSAIAPLQDAQEAMKVVRARAKEWNLDSNKIGVLGFSAGGHVASTIGTHYTQAYIKNENNVSLRPDFLLLLYPVISFTDSLAHMGSRNNLLGKNAGKDSVILFSNELQVNAQTPPSFLVHAADDKSVKCENSIQFFMALKKNNVPAELHIYEKGGHGFGLHNTTTDDQWFDRAINWLKSNRLL